MNKFSSGYKLKSITNKIIQASVNNYAKASGDLNPIHLDDKYAANSFFGQKIAHGALIYSLIS